MSMHSPDDPSPRRRLSRDERQRQLLEVAWRLVREEGTEALTLGRLAEQAGVDATLLAEALAGGTPLASSTVVETTP